MLYHTALWVKHAKERAQTFSLNAQLRVVLCHIMSPCFSSAFSPSYLFLDASSHLCKRVCPLVGLYIGPLVFWGISSGGGDVPWVHTGQASKPWDLASASMAWIQSLGPGSHPQAMALAHGPWLQPPGSSPSPWALAPAPGPRHPPIKGRQGGLGWRRSGKNCHVDP